MSKPLKPSKRGSPEWRARISAGRAWYRPTEETVRKIALANLGKKRSKETCQRISEATRGKPKSRPINGNSSWWSSSHPAPHTKEQHRKIGLKVAARLRGRELPEKWKENISKGQRRRTKYMTGKKDLGERAYVAVHRWMQVRFGKPLFCEMCGITEAPEGKIPTMYFQWANKDERFLRDRENWLRLCVKCHRHFDLNKKTK